MIIRAALVTITAAELLHAGAGRRAAPGPATGPCGVVVLGNPRPALQRWRVQLGVRTLEAAGGGRLVCSGAGEAEAMAGYARSLGVEALVEPAARTTGENVAFSLPLVEDLPRIAFVSDPLHALRARRLAAAQRPELADRLVAGDC